MADKKSNDPKFDHNLSFTTRSGNQVLAVKFENEDKLMGVIIEKDGSNGQFCSWEMSTGKRIGMGCTSNGKHAQDLVNSGT